jgi:hypothetical protein
VADSTKTLTDQIKEIDKLVNDGMDRLTQAQLGLRSLEERVKAQADDGRKASDSQ